MLHDEPVLLAAIASVAWARGLVWAQDAGPTPGAPTYTADSIASSAANVAGYYAPDSFLSIYGQNLAYTTQAISSGDIRDGQLQSRSSG